MIIEVEIIRIFCTIGHGYFLVHGRMKEDEFYEIIQEGEKMWSDGKVKRG